MLRPKTIKLSEENIGQKFHDIGFGNFSALTPKAHVTKEKNRQIVLHKN